MHIAPRWFNPTKLPEVAFYTINTFLWNNPRNSNGALPEVETDEKSDLTFFEGLCKNPLTPRAELYPRTITGRATGKRPWQVIFNNWPAKQAPNMLPPRDCSALVLGNPEHTIAIERRLRESHEAQGFVFNEPERVCFDGLAGTSTADELLVLNKADEPERLLRFAQKAATKNPPKYVKVFSDILQALEQGSTWGPTDD